MQTVVQDCSSGLFLFVSRRSGSRSFYLRGSAFADALHVRIPRLVFSARRDQLANLAVGVRAESYERGPTGKIIGERTARRRRRLNLICFCFSSLLCRLAIEFRVEPPTNPDCELVNKTLRLAEQAEWSKPESNGYACASLLRLFKRLHYRLNGPAASALIGHVLFVPEHVEQRFEPRLVRDSF